MYTFFVVCLQFYKELSLEDILNVSSYHVWNYYALYKEFFKKVFLVDIDTHAIISISILKKLIDSLQIKDLY